MTDVSAIGISRTAPSSPGGTKTAPQEEALRELAVKFETAFLTEMLRHSGLGEMPESFNGGAGEARYSGFLIEAYAAEISKTGQIGLADQIYRDLVARNAQ